MEKIIGFWAGNGMVQPIAWTARKISKSEAKRIVSRFRNDSDYEKHVIMDWWRFYKDKRDMKRELSQV